MRAAPRSDDVRRAELCRDSRRGSSESKLLGQRHIFTKELCEVAERSMDRMRVASQSRNQVSQGWQREGRKTGRDKPGRTSGQWSAGEGSQGAWERRCGVEKQRRPWRRTNESRPAPPRTTQVKNPTGRRSRWNVPVAASGGLAMVAGRLNLGVV